MFNMEHINNVVIPVLADVIELVGVIIIGVSVFIGIWNLVVKNKFRFRATEKNPIINQGLAASLEILLAAEILKTLVARDLHAIGEVGALVIIRILITVVIHWELSEKEKTIKLERIEKDRDIRFKKELLRRAHEDYDL